MHLDRGTGVPQLVGQLVRLADEERATATVPVPRGAHDDGIAQCVVIDLVGWNAPSRSLPSSAPSGALSTSAKLTDGSRLRQAFAAVRQSVLTDIRCAVLVSAQAAYIAPLPLSTISSLLEQK